jgi:DNA-3-methyladenine glycosylase II
MSPEGAPEPGLITLRTRGPFSLAASTRFLEHPSPAAGTHSSPQPDHLHLAFVVDGTESAAGVCLQPLDGGVRLEVAGPVDREIVARQVERTLSLDVDGSGWPAVGRRDPVIGGLQERYPGLRPVLFYSPYESAAWALISHRIRITQASTVKARMTEALGDEVVIHGDRLRAFPAPRVLRTLQEGTPGFFGAKVARLRALAEAATDGRLDAARLRALPVDRALDELKALPGVGDFSAQLILIRGLGLTDALPTAEPRLLRAVALLYDLAGPPDGETLTAIAEPWRPFRTWASVLLRTWLEDETGEISGRRPVDRSRVAGAGRSCGQASKRRKMATAF